MKFKNGKISFYIFEYKINFISYEKKKKKLIKFRSTNHHFKDYNLAIVEHPIILIFTSNKIPYVEFPFVNLPLIFK